MFLLTFHGRLLAVDADGRLIQRAVSPGMSFDGLVEIEAPRDPEGFRFQRCVENRRDEPEEAPADGALAGFGVRLHADRRNISFFRDGMFARAVPDGGVAFDRPGIGGWESFAYVSRRDVLDLIHILSHDWIVGSTQIRVRSRDVSLGDNFQLRIGGLNADIRYNLPFLGSARTSALVEDVSPGFEGELLSFVLLREGWRAEKLFLFKPLIFITAFKAPIYIEQAVLCMSSLLEFGRYEGPLHLITDQPRETFLQALPGLDPSRLTVQTIAAEDWVGYVTAKYAILEAPQAHACQPVMFIDPDIVADADLTPMLTAVATSPLIMAPMENWHVLSNSPSMGSSLIQQTGGRPGIACGFNAGTIGIPNLSVFGVHLRTIRAAIANRIELVRRDDFMFVDQEIANYILFTLGGVDTGTLLRCVRAGFEGDELDATRRIGLVHFWPAKQRHLKNVAMRTYIETLRKAERRLAADAFDPMRLQGGAVARPA